MLRRIAKPMPRSKRALPALCDGFHASQRFESLLVQFLQTITPLSNTHYREIDDAISELPAVTDVAQRTATLAKRKSIAASHPQHLEHTSTRAPEHPSTRAPQHPNAPNADALAYVGFEDRFRGSESAIRARLVDYLPDFAGQSDVLDMGCGRGEFSTCCVTRAPATGLDFNPEMVEVCRARGLDAKVGDARTYLQSMPDESLGGRSRCRYRAPRAGLSLAGAWSGVRQAETGRQSRARDDHPGLLGCVLRKLHPRPHTRQADPSGDAAYLLQASGFTNVEIVYRSPIAPDGSCARRRARPEDSADTRDPLTELVCSFNRNVDRLYQRMFTFQDLAAIATRP